METSAKIIINDSRLMKEVVDNIKHKAILMLAYPPAGGYFKTKRRKYKMTKKLLSFSQKEYIHNADIDEIGTMAQCKMQNAN